MTQVIQSRTKNRIVGLGILVGGTFFGAVLGSSSDVLAVIVILASLTIGGYALITGAGEGTAACPLCDKTFQISSLSKHSRCPWCFGYSERNKEQLLAVEDGHAEAKPAFLLPLLKTYRFPQICCACGQSATGSRTAHTSYNLRSELLPTVKHIKCSLDIPYCEVHGKSNEAADTVDSSLLGPGLAAALDYRSKKAGAVSLYPVPGLKVSSYRFYREFLRLNGIKNYVDPQISW
jgi:hypothetical protein